jgi:3-oxoacyl-[acyl-carrier-protein] synthase-3
MLGQSKNNRVVGVGSSLPKMCVGNQELVDRLAVMGVQTSDEWIKERTGICQRYFVSDGEDVLSLATEAALNAVHFSGRHVVEDVDLIIVATSTPDYIFPSVACLLQAKIGAKKAVAFDIQAVCSGFVYALAIADTMLSSGQYSRALVVGAECFSRIMDWKDRGTCVLFGDGAGAVLLESGHSDGILRTLLRSDGSQSACLMTPGRLENGNVVGDPFLRMDGQAVFKLAVSCLTDISVEILKQEQWDVDCLDYVIPHQANERIMQALVKRLGLNASKMISTVDRYANTSAASIPMALDFAVRDGRVKVGHKGLLLGVGGGFTWGAVLLSF